MTTDPEYTEARHKGKQGPERPQGGSHLFFFLQYFSLYFLFTPCHMKEIDKNVSVLINMITFFRISCILIHIVIINPKLLSVMAVFFMSIFH